MEHLLMCIVEDNSLTAANQTNLLNKQTAILQSLQAPVMKRLPATHFMPNQSDGISFDTSSHHLYIKPTNPHEEDDVHSIQSTASVVIHNQKPDKKLKMCAFQTEWIEDNHNC